MMKPLLIFGGSGFLGQAICREAIKQTIPVISFSRSGSPKNHFLSSHPLITWIKTDIFSETNWQPYVENSFGVINLIGILRENKNKNITYQKMIVLANQLITDQVAHYPKLPYVFLSANAGGPVIPIEYIQHKRQAETYLKQLRNPVIVIRPGLVVGTGRPFSLVEGSGVFLLAHLPIINHYFRPVYPIGINRLAKRVLAEIKQPYTSCLTPDQL